MNFWLICKHFKLVKQADHTNWLPNHTNFENFSVKHGFVPSHFTIGTRTVQLWKKPNESLADILNFVHAVDLLPDAGFPN